MVIRKLNSRQRQLRRFVARQQVRSYRVGEPSDESKTDPQIEKRMKQLWFRPTAKRSRLVTTSIPGLYTLVGTRGFGTVQPGKAYQDFAARMRARRSAASFLQYLLR